MLHAAGQIWLRSLDQGVDVIGHPTEGQDDPSAALDFVSKPLGKPLVVTGIMEELAPTIPSGDDVIIGTGELDARWSRHRMGLKKRASTNESTSLPPNNTEHKA
jgi:hypothetical protein